MSATTQADAGEATGLCRDPALSLCPAMDTSASVSAGSGRAPGMISAFSRSKMPRGQGGPSGHRVETD